MRQSRWLLVIAVLALAGPEARAQLIITSNGPFFPGFNTYANWGAYSTRLGHGRLTLGFSSLGASSYAGGFGPGFFGPGILFPNRGFFGAYSQTTIIYSPPVIIAPTPFLVPVPVGAPLDPLAFNAPLDDPLAMGQLRQAPFDDMRPLPERPRNRLPDRPRAAFVDPPFERRARAPAPRVNPPRPEPQPKAPQKQPPPPPRPAPPPVPQPPPMPPQPPAPAKDPADENARQVNLGLQAFKASAYGKSAQHFRLAIQVAPRLPQAHFLLAQALLALGKYPEAVAAIQAGMALQPNWPNVRFHPLELYGDNRADYTEHLRRLDQIVQANGRDPLLLFLYAYQLWFADRRNEAKVWFEKALPGSPHADLIRRFLQALPRAPAL